MKIYCLFILLLSTLNISLGIAEESSIYQKNILTIPRVDTPSQIGQYQNAQFKRADDGRWDLIHVNEPKLAQIDAIDFILLETFPVQLHVSISGTFPNGCYGLGQTYQRQEADRFEIAVYQVELQTFAACTQALVPFHTTLPFDISGLHKGTYQVIVNNIAGSFELTTDNFHQTKIQKQPN